MVKQALQGKGTTVRGCREPSDSQKWASQIKSTRNIHHFFQFLKQLHHSQIQINSDSHPMVSQLINGASALMNFFNYQKNYSAQELDNSVICLANLFNVLGDKICELRFQREFRIKIRRFLMNLLQVSDEGDGRCGRRCQVQAIFYILVVLIYKERGSQVDGVRELNALLFKDRVLVKSLIQVHVPSQKRISKFYGIIIIYLSNRVTGRKQREMLVRGVLCNLSKINHESSIFNMVVYLRKEKNKISLSWQQVLDGKVVPTLINWYRRTVEKYQSFYLLDYLLYLTSLFPGLGEQIAAEGFILFLIRSTKMNLLHHPLHESCIIRTIEHGLRFMNQEARLQLLAVMDTIDFKNHFLMLKLAKVIIDSERSVGALVKLMEKPFYEQLISLVKVDTEINCLKKSVEILLWLLCKLKQWNKDIAMVLIECLERRMEGLDVLGGQMRQVVIIRRQCEC